MAELMKTQTKTEANRLGATSGLERFGWLYPAFRPFEGQGAVRQDMRDEIHDIVGRPELC